MWWARRIAIAASAWAVVPRPRASIHPRTGAETAWVSGIPTRAGPMIATVWSIAAALVPAPTRKPPRSDARAIATPPASATANPPDGRDARGEEGGGGDVAEAGVGHRPHCGSRGGALAQRCRNHSPLTISRKTTRLRPSTVTTSQ